MMTRPVLDLGGVIAPLPLLCAVDDVLMLIGGERRVLEMHVPAKAEAARVVSWAQQDGLLNEELWRIAQTTERTRSTVAELQVSADVVIEVRAAAQAGGIALALHDCSEHQQLEARLIQAERERVLAETRALVAETERLAALGTLAAGIAHEVNSPLTYVLANLEFIREETSASANTELRSAIDQALEGATRVVQIVRDMKQLSRQGELDGNAVVDVTRAVKAAANLARATSKTKARIELALSPLESVRGSESQLTQVLLNVVLNGVQAMPPRPTSECLVSISGACEGDFVVLRVKDNGVGIPEDVRPRVFDPFFTTKPAGVGTGLGLSISRTIVEKMGGTLSLSSQVSAGTEVAIRLPKAS